MRDFAGFRGRSLPGIAGAVVVGVGAVALGVFMVLQRGPDPAADRPAPDIAAAPPPQGAPPPPDAAPVPETVRVPAPAPPALDTFRLEADGRMIVAGRAVPGGSVAILVDEARLGQAEADASGKFVAFLDLPAAETARALSLALILPDGREVRAREEILIAPTTRAAPVPAAPPPAPGHPQEDAPAEVAATPSGAPPSPAPKAPAAREPPVETALAPGATTQSAPERPVVLVSNEEGVRVIQSPAEPAPNVRSVVLDSISYSGTGEVELAGRASAPDGQVAIYIDNRLVTTSRIGEDGNWRSDLPDVASGIYTLRVDEVSPEGVVSSRIETPFKREAPGAASGTPRSSRISVVTVQPGSTLWAISREHYGEGVLYVRVFEANRERIRDPDLIYPGQVFALPD